MTIPTLTGDAASHFERWKSAAPSWWHRTIRPEELPTPAPLPSRVQYAIVGLGIAGAATAYELVRRGVDAKDIVLLDGARTAFGASGRNGGFVLSNPGGEALDWLAHHPEHVVRDLIRENIRNRELVAAFLREHALDHQPGGSFTLSESEDESAEVRGVHNVIARAGGTGYELRPHFSGPAAGHYRHACLVQPADCGVHPVRYTAAVVRASGVAVVEDCPLSRGNIRVSADGVELATPKGLLRAERVVLATNAFAALLLDGVRITPARNQVLVVELAGESTNALWGDGIHYANRGYDYWRQLPDGRLLVGGGRDRDAGGETTWELADNPRVLAYLREVLVPRLAAGHPAREVARWQGIMGFTRDKLPVIRAEAGGRLTFLGGFSGYGLGFHRIAAERLVQHLLDSVPLGIFDSARLQDPPPA